MYWVVHAKTSWDPWDLRRTVIDLPCKNGENQSWYPQSFSGSKLHPNLEPDQLGGWSGQHDGVIGIHNYVVQLYTVLDNIQFSFFLNSTSIKLSFGKIYV